MGIPGRGGAPAPLSSCCCRASRAVSSAANALGQPQPAGREEPWQLCSHYRPDCGWRANSPPRVTQSTPPQIPTGAILEGQPATSTPLLATAWPRWPTPPGLAPHPPASPSLFPSHGGRSPAKRRWWGVGRYLEGKVLTIAPRGGENGLRLFGFYQPLLDQAAIEFLNVCVHTLPIWLAHPDHVLHVQQLRTVRVLPGGREREGQASDRSPVGEGRKRENKRHGSMQFPSLPQADAALLSHAPGVRDAGAGGLQAPPRQGHSVRFGGAQAREGKDG